MKTLQSKYQEPIQIEVEPLKNYVEAGELSSGLSPQENPEWLLSYRHQKADGPLIDDKNTQKPSDTELKPKLTAPI